jgi:hypothetical protein
MPERISWIATSPLDFARGLELAEQAALLAMTKRM